MLILRHAAWLLAKDIRVELRARELLLSVALFSVVIVLVFSFALATGLRPTMDVCAGMLWTATSLAAVIGVGRAFEREREHDTLRGLMLLPISPAAIYLSKLLGIFLLVSFVQTVVSLLIVLLFNLHLSLQVVVPIVVLQLLGGLGVAAVASLFGASLGRARSREVLLPLVIYPLSVPVLIAGARGTAALLVGESSELWLKLLLVLCLVFITLGLWLFGLLAGDHG